MAQPLAASRRVSSSASSFRPLGGVSSTLSSSISGRQRRALGYAATALVALVGALVDHPPWRVVETWGFSLPEGAGFFAFAAGAGLLAGLAWTLLLEELRETKFLGAQEGPLDPTMVGGWGVVFAIAAAVTEELLFRGAAAQLLFGGIAGAVISSIAFALIHHAQGEQATARAWLVYGIFGLSQCVFMFATGSIIGPMVTHAFVNLTMLRRAVVRQEAYDG